MKRTIKILSLCSVILILFSTFCMAADVTSINENENLLTAPATADNTNKISIVNSDLYIAEDNVIISDYINGNAYAIGDTVTVKGQIDGDLFILAKDSIIIDPSAKIAGNLFAFSKQITLDGAVCDVYAFTSNFTVGSNGYIFRDLRLYSSNLSVQGKIGKDVFVYANDIVFPENSKNLIGGDLHYTSTQEISIPEGVVTGSVDFTQDVQEESTQKTNTISNYINNFVRVLIYAVVVILLASFITPKFADKATYVMSKKPFATAGIGILSIIAVPIVSIILLITGFLSYVSIALVSVYCLILSITISILGIAIGNYFATKIKNNFKGKLILLSCASVAIIWILQQLPIVGPFISLFTVVFGLGIFVYALFAKQSKVETKVEEKVKE